MKLKIGTIAPQFTLFDQNKVEHSLSDHLGEWVLLYFYPKDNTPGCTVEAKGIRDLHEKFEKLNLCVLGVSKDTAGSHSRFIEKYKLPFTLLSDSDKKLAKTYDSLGKKRFMGREYMGVLRNSFLIDEKGVIKKIYEGVTPATHAKEVLEDVKALQV